MIDVYPTKFEAYDDDYRMFKIDANDGVTATITITAPCDVNEWDRIAPVIRQCLVDMKLEGDIK